MRSNGDILISGFKFEKKLWCRVVPRTCDWLNDLFGKVCDDNQLNFVTNLSNPIKINNQNRHFTIGDDWSSENMKFDMDELVIEQICSVLLMCLHGMGFGAMRGTEVNKLDL